MVIEEIRQAIQSGSIEYSAHCLERMLMRGISRADVVECIKSGEIIEDYPLKAENTSEKSFPSCLVLGIRAKDNRYIHVVLGYNKNKILIISVYYPDLVHWCDDYKTRRKSNV